MTSLTTAPSGAAASPVARRVALPRWMDVRLLAGLTLVLLSIAAGARLVANAQHTVAVVAVTRDLATGTRIETSQLTLVQVRLPGRSKVTYARQFAAVAGKQLNRPLATGELVPAAALGDPDAGVTVVVPLPPDSAPSLAAGQRVSIWLSSPACSARLLLDDVPVQSVHDNRAASFATAGGQTIVVRVAPELAARVMAAFAIDDVQLRGVQVDGPSRSGVDLPDIAGCRAADR